MKADWLALCRHAENNMTPAFYAGGRKIFRQVHWSFDLEDDLEPSDAGYTKSKMTMLRRLYLHEESQNAALEQWATRRVKRKYASVSFHCFNHTLKGSKENASRISSVMGPCLQSVILTYMPDHSVAVDVNYRTTELYKKFPADLVFLRETLLAPFELPQGTRVTCHFANATLHPMYYVTTIPHQADPVTLLEELEGADEYFHRQTIKWLQRYLCPEHITGIAKYAQAMRVHKDASERVSARSTTRLRKYLRSAKFEAVDAATKEDEDDS